MNFRLLSGRRYFFIFQLLILSSVACAADCTPPPSGLVSWWPADGNANDVVGTNNGVLQGGATANYPGMVGAAFKFNGTNGYVSIADSAALRPATFTIEGWVMFTGLDGWVNSNPGHQYIVFKQNTVTSLYDNFGIAYGIGKDRYPNVPAPYTNGDVLYFNVIGSSGTMVEIDSTTVVQTNVWYHWAAVRGTNYIEFYINGGLEGRLPVGFAQYYKGNWPVYFGTTGQPTIWDGKLKGALDEVSFYNRALSSNEIIAIYQAGSAGKCRSLPPSSTQLSLSTNLAVYGTSVTFTSTVTGSVVTPTGTVAFIDGANTLGAGVLNGSGVATFSTNKLSAAGSPHSVSAVYGGDADYAGSTSGPVSLAVTAATLTPIVTISNKIYDGTMVADISNRTLVGTIDADDVNLGTNEIASFDDKNVGADKTATVTGLTLTGTAAGNYQLSSDSTTTTASVFARDLTVTAEADTKPYDGTTAATVAPSVTAGSLQSTDTANFFETYDTKDVGFNKALAADGTINDGNGGNNYQVTYVSTNAGVITPASLTVTADNKTRWFGAANPPLTAQFSGFVDGETTNVLAGSPNLSTSATPGSAPGDYPISASAGTLGATNYTFSFVNGTLTVLDLPQLNVIGPDGNSFVFSFPTVSGQSYQVEYNSNLLSGAWIPVGGLIDGGGSPIFITNDMTEPEGYYRLNLQP